MPEHFVQRLVADLAQDGIHHDQQADGFAARNVRTDYIERKGGPANVPMGIETPTNLPFFSAGPTSSTKLPKMMPMAMARKIQSAKSLSSQPRAFKADSLPFSGGVQGP